MSQENVEIVRELYEAWNGPDGWHAALEFIAEDFEWVNPPYAVESGTRFGRAGWFAARDSVEAAFHVGTHEVVEFRELGERVLCFCIFEARTTADGVAFKQDQPHLWSLRDGKVVRFEWFHDRREALEAVGLSE